MGWLGKSEYNCPECDGDGEYDCPECGAECVCDHCDGTGWDPDKVDVPAFAKAEEALFQIMRDAKCAALTSEWIVDGKRLGRTGGSYGQVAVKDFLLDE